MAFILRCFGCMTNINKLNNIILPENIQNQRNENNSTTITENRENTEDQTETLKMEDYDSDAMAKLKIITNISEIDLKDNRINTPERKNRKIYKYICPICFRFFSHMLHTSCCSNYICYECTKLLEEKEIKQPEFSARCPHCCNSTLIMGDVNKLSPVRIYTDTPQQSQQNTIKFNSNDSSPNNSPNIRQAKSAIDFAKTTNQNLPPIHPSTLTQNNIFKHLNNTYNRSNYMKSHPSVFQREQLYDNFNTSDLNNITNIKVSSSENTSDVNDYLSADKDDLDNSNDNCGDIDDDFYNSARSLHEFVINSNILCQDKKLLRSISLDRFK